MRLCTTVPCHDVLFIASDASSGDTEGRKSSLGFLAFFFFFFDEGQLFGTQVNNDQ